MSDLDIIKQLEEILNVKLNQVNEIYWQRPGRYSLDQKGQVTGMTLFNSKIDNKKLHHIISPLKELKNLTKLYLYDNQISDISPLKELYKKDDIEIAVDNNPIKNPPIEIVQQGKKAIRRYFEQIDQQGKDKIYEAKLMIVGEPGAGKTTLLNKLFDRDFIVPNLEQKSTLGVEVRKNWEFRFDKFNDRKEINYKAHIWDFGGQQIQYMLHQFFLTGDCLYVLMAEKRRELANFDYWLNIINILGNNSPVILLFNEINIDTATSFIYDEKKYKELFPNLQLYKLDVNFANMKDGRFDTLVNIINEKLAGLEHIGKEVPARWVDIRRELEERSSEKHVTINEYFNICHKYGIDDEEDRMFILKYFNILGIVLHFPDDLNLRDTLFLDPNWTVDAVYSVLTDTEIENNKGLFKTQKIDKIWSNKGYKREERTQLLQLMLKDNFELCYKIPNKNDEYLVPLLLCKIKPVYDWDEGGNLQFRFQYPFMPKGIVSRLIVRLNEFLEQDKLWNEGAVFGRNGARAQVTESTTAKEGLKIIEIRLAGKANNRKELLILMREEIRKIQDNSFPSLPYLEMVPCNCEKCSKSEVPDFYDTKTLDEFLAANDYEIQCRNSRKMVNIFRLIDTVYDNSYLVKEMFGNYQSLLSLLIDKKFYLEKELVVAYDTEKKFGLKKQLEELEKQIEELKRKLK